MNKSLLQFAHSTVRRSMRFSLCIALSGALCLLGAGTAWGQLSLTPDANADGVPDLTPCPAFMKPIFGGHITGFSAAILSASAGSFVAHS